MNQERAHFNMVEQQIRTWKVIDPIVLGVLDRVPREPFVPKQYEGLAYSEAEIPLPNGRTMMPPLIVARILAAVGTMRAKNALLIGVESGYLAALLAQRAEWVRCLESDPSLLNLAADNLDAAGVENVILESGTPSEGWPARAPFDLIVVNGGLPALPQNLIEQLAPRGRLCAFIGHRPILTLQCLHKDAAGACTTEVLFETDVSMLEADPIETRFQF